MQTIAPFEQKHVQNAKLYANRIELIKDLKLPSSPNIAEVGVAFGDFSLELLNKFQPSSFVALDLFKLHDIETIWGRPSVELLEGKKHFQFYKDRLEKAKGDCRIVYCEGDSSTNLAKQDAHFDLIYIDGDHHYDGVVKDTQVAISKLKTNGYLIFNDYIYKDHYANEEYGIIPVVNDLCVNKGWYVHGFAFQHAMFCDICLSRRPVE